MIGDRFADRFLTLESIKKWIFLLGSEDGNGNSNAP